MNFCFSGVPNRMGSFSVEEFVGNGVLKGVLPKLIEDGWDDVSTLKIMSPGDMNAINMTQQQKVLGYLQIYFSSELINFYLDVVCLIIKFLISKFSTF